LFGGLIVRYCFHDQPIYALVMGGVFMIVAAVAVLNVKEQRA
jgi:maltose/moltooligosaccharide transporter